MLRDTGNEPALIDAAKRGSTEAFTRLIARYREGLFRYLLTRSACRADAEDALQDTLMNAYRYLDSYDSRWRFSTWLYRIAIRNAASNRSEPSRDVDDLHDAGANPLEHCIVASERENLWRLARELLTDEVYTAMWLRYVEELSIRDVASVLDRSESWAKVNLMRGRDALDEAVNIEPDRARSTTYG